MLCAACLTPIPMSRRVQTPGGAAEPVELGFLQAGKTGQDEVRSRLKPIDSGYPHEAFFWGRWIASSSGVAWFVGGASPGVGPAGAAGANRHWSAKNLLVEFDAEGKVRSHRVVDDGDITRELRAAIRSYPPRAPADGPEKLAIEHLHRSGQALAPAELVLGEVLLEMNEPGSKHAVSVARAELLDVRPADTYIRGRQPEPGFLLQTLHFRSKTPAGKKVTIRLQPAALVRLLAYVDSPPHP